MSDIESRTPRVRSSFKAGTLRRRTPIGTAVLLALAPVSLLTVSSAANATLVDNLVYSSQLPQNLGPLVPSVASGLTPGQLIVSGPVDGMTPTDALGTNSVAIGVNAHAMGDYAVAAGSYVNAAAGSVAVGTGVYSNGNESTSLGVRTDAESDRSLAVGWRTSVGANGADSLAIGSYTRVSSAAAGGIGKNNVVGGAGTYVLGNANKASGSDSFVLGSNVTASGNSSVVLGANSDGSLSNVISVGDTGMERRIVHVGAGREGTDAVNLNQLKALGATTDTAGALSNGFVAYDNLDKTTIALGGTSGQAVRVSNVADHGRKIRIVGERRDHPHDPGQGQEAEPK